MSGQGPTVSLTLVKFKEWPPRAFRAFPEPFSEVSLGLNCLQPGLSKMLTTET